MRFEFLLPALVAVNHCFASPVDLVKDLYEDDSSFRLSVRRYFGPFQRSTAGAPPATTQITTIVKTIAATSAVPSPQASSAEQAATSSAAQTNTVAATATPATPVPQVASAGLTTVDQMFLQDISKGLVISQIPVPDPRITVSDSGFFRMNFKNNFSQRLILIAWIQNNFNNHPVLAQSLAPGESIKLGIDDGLPGGGFAAIYPDSCVAKLNEMNSCMKDGNIYDTWGEFSTKGLYSTIDVSKQAKMDGHPIKIYNEATGCTANDTQCSFVCKSGNSCWESGSYSLIGCAPATNSGAGTGEVDGNPSGGCMMGNGGDVDVTFG